MEKKRPYEIGSHFEMTSIENKGVDENILWLPKGSASTFTLSGRGAIELAIVDIMAKVKIETVYLPSYSCDSMKQPFIDKDINIIYYDVLYDEDKGLTYDIDFNVKCDIFFVMTYFGLGRFSLDLAVDNFRERDSVIIEDITHRLLCGDSYSEKSHYLVASIRKWLPIPAGGYIVKNEGCLRHKPSLESRDIVNIKIEAMVEKQLYLEGKEAVKESYLNKSQEFENKLKKASKDYKIDGLSLKTIKTIDINRIRSQRRKNGKILYDGLDEFKYIKPLIMEVDLDDDCPLFIPIILDKGKRDNLREFLIKNNIYCPIHWPQRVNNSKGIEGNELSLICDQRYDEDDMRYVLNLIRQWEIEVKS